MNEPPHNGHTEHASPEHANTDVLRLLRRDFRRVSDTLAHVASLALGDGVTQFPVFVACRQPIALGVLVIDAAQMGLTFSFRISMYEELVKKGLLEAENEKAFKVTFGDPFHKASVLLVEEGHAQFIFIPYSPEADTTPQHEQ